MRILTINIWNRLGPWERRRELLRAGLAELHADVVGMQEVLHLDGVPDTTGDAKRRDPSDPAGERSEPSRDQAQELGAGVYEHTAYAPAWTMGGGLSMGNALLSRWPIVEHAAFALPVPDGEPQGRVLLYALLDAPFGRVPVFVTHLTWQLYATDTRCAQVRAIDDRVREVVPKGGFPPILMGDMNAEPDADEMRFLRGLTALGGRGTYWADAWACCGEGPGYTFDRKNEFALRPHEPSRRIDYVFARGPDRAMRGEPLSARIVLDREVAGCWPSDHYGLLAEIQTAPRPVVKDVL